MGKVYTCDCGKQKVMPREDLIEMGLSRCLYCKGDCEARVQVFLDARDELHDEIIDMWKDGIANLHAEMGKDFKLPEQWESDQ